MTRGLAEIVADLDALNRRQSQLLEELAQAQAIDPVLVPRTPAVEGPIVCRKKAAAAIGWRVDRLTRAIVNHNASNPEDPIGWQAGGNKNARWEIPLARLLRFVRNQPLPTPTHQNTTHCTNMRGALNS